MFKNQDIINSEKRDTKSAKNLIGKSVVFSKQTASFYAIKEASAFGDQVTSSLNF